MRAVMRKSPKRPLPNLIYTDKEGAKSNDTHILGDLAAVPRVQGEVPRPGGYRRESLGQPRTE